MIGNGELPYTTYKKMVMTGGMLQGLFFFATWGHDFTSGVQKLGHAASVWTASGNAVGT